MATNRFILISSENQMDEYETLDITQILSKDEIKKKYLNLLAIVHPENGTKPDAKQFQDVIEAYKKISQSAIQFNTEKDPYKVFELDKNATVEQINKAFKILARKYHPDIYPKATLGEKRMLSKQFQSISDMKDQLIKKSKENIKSSDEKAEQKSQKNKTQFGSHSFFSDPANVAAGFNPAVDIISGLRNLKRDTEIYIARCVEENKKSKNKLIFSIMNNSKIEDIEKIIKENLDLLRSVDSNGNTLVHIACLAQRPDVLTLLNKYKADFNAKNNKGFPPSHTVVQVGSTECCKILMDCGANFGESVTYKF